MNPKYIVFDKEMEDFYTFYETKELKDFLIGAAEDADDKEMIERDLFVYDLEKRENVFFDIEPINDERVEVTLEWENRGENYYDGPEER